MYIIIIITNSLINIQQFLIIINLNIEDIQKIY